MCSSRCSRRCRTSASSCSADDPGALPPPTGRASNARGGAHVEDAVTWTPLLTLCTDTAGSALPPSVFAGMIVCYHPLSVPSQSQGFQLLSTRREREMAWCRVAWSSDVAPAPGRRALAARTARLKYIRFTSSPGSGDLRLVLTGWRPPRVAPPPRPHSCMYLLTSRGLTPADHANTQHCTLADQVPAPWKLDAGRGMELSRLDSHWRLISPESDRR